MILTALTGNYEGVLQSIRFACRKVRYPKLLLSLNTRWLF